MGTTVIEVRRPSLLLSFQTFLCSFSITLLCFLYLLSTCLGMKLTTWNSNSKSRSIQIQTAAGEGRPMVGPGRREDRAERRRKEETKTLVISGLGWGEARS